MANKTVYPYGTSGSLPSSIGLINDCITGGADKALAAQQGVVLQEQIDKVAGDVSGINLSIADFDVFQVLTNSSTISDQGTRLRCVKYIPAGCDIYAACSAGKGCAASIYDTLEHALFASATTGNIQTIASSYAASVSAKSEVSGYLCISLCKNDSGIFSAQDKADFVAATTADVVKTGSVIFNGFSLENFLVGAGQTYVSKDLFSITPGKTYRVAIKNPSWDMTGITGDTNYKFTIRNFYNGSNTLEFVGAKLPDTVDSEYIIRIPDNSDFVRVGCRASSGTQVAFSFTEISVPIVASALFATYQPYAVAYNDVADGKPYLDLSSSCILVLSDNTRVSMASVFNNMEYRKILLKAGTATTALVFINTKTWAFSVYTWENVPNNIDGLYLIATCRTDGNRLVNISANFPIRNTSVSGNYSGERIILEKSFCSTRMFQLSNLSGYSSITNIAPQGMDVYGDYLVQGMSERTVSGTTKKAAIVIIDIKNYAVLGYIELNESDCHSNNINFSKVKYNSGDTLPLIYFSRSGGTHDCYVIRIANTFDSYTIVQTIRYSGDSYVDVTYQDWFIDGGFLYAFGRHSTETTLDYERDILKFALPALEESLVELGDEDVLDSYVLKGVPVGQGSRIIAGKLFYAYGYGTTEYPNGILVYDFDREEIVSRVPGVISGEPEDIAVYHGGLVIPKYSTTAPEWHFVTFN